MYRVPDAMEIFFVVTLPSESLRLLLSEAATDAVPDKALGIFDSSRAFSEPRRCEKFAWSCRPKPYIRGAMGRT